MTTRALPAYMYRVPDPDDRRITELEAIVLDLNDENAKLRQEVMEPAKAPVTVVRGHVLLEVPVPDAHLVFARGTARFLMGADYAQKLATEIYRACGKARAQRREIEATEGNLPRTFEEERLLAKERP